MRFDTGLQTYVCDCGKSFKAQAAARRRGWARSCGKSCAAKKREAGKK